MAGTIFSIIVILFIWALPLIEFLLFGLFIVWAIKSVIKAQKGQIEQLIQEKQNQPVNDLSLVDYQPLLVAPAHFPRFIYESKEKYKSWAMAVFCVGCFVTVPILFESVIFGLISTIIFLIPIVCLMITYKHKEMPYLLLSDKSLSYEGVTIPYNEIESIAHLSEEKQNSKHRGIVHYLEIKNSRKTLKIEAIKFSPVDLAEIINCCLYSNSSIVIDTVVMKFLINSTKQIYSTFK